MPDESNTVARGVIDLWARELAEQQNHRILWQQVADRMLSRFNRITEQRMPGEDKSLLVYDDTATESLRELAAGLSSATVQTGQHFYEIRLRDKQLAEASDADRAIWKLVEDAHVELFTSNFVSRYNQMLAPYGGFGQGCLYCDFSRKSLKLTFKNIDIADYVFLENSDGEIDTVLVSFTLSARQAVQNYGEEGLPKEILDAANDPARSSDKFKFIQIVRPRKDRNANKKNWQNMSFESLHVAVDAQKVVREGGYRQMPFIIFRWIVASGEKYGRGQGTEYLARIKVLDKMVKDYVDIANRWAHPPYEKDSRFEGEVDLRPDGENPVIEMGMIKALDQRMLGNMPITERAIELYTDKIQKVFFVDVFRSLSALTGNQRMTQLEVSERLREGMKRISPMAAQLYEDMNRLIERITDLLLQNGRVVLPAKLNGAEWSIEYLGALALALRDKEAAGFMRFSEFVMNIAEVVPESLDTVNFDEAVPDMAKYMGVKSTHISTQERIDAIREARAKQQAAAQAMAMAEQAGKANRGLSVAPEEGSPAEQLVGAGA